jgi:hypothetical protein
LKQDPLILVAVGDSLASGELLLGSNSGKRIVWIVLRAGHDQASIKALLHRKGMQLGCDAISGALLLRLAVEGAQLRFALELADVKVRLQADEATPA